MLGRSETDFRDRKPGVQAGKAVVGLKYTRSVLILCELCCLPPLWGLSFPICTRMFPEGALASLAWKVTNSSVEWSRRAMAVERVGPHLWALD